MKSSKEGVKIYVGGPQGVGKTTLVKSFSQKYNIPFWTSSQVFMDYFHTDRDGLKDIDETDPNLINEVFGNFYKTHDNFVLDGHYRLAQSATKDTFDLCLFLYADIEEILKRKKLDSTRVRLDNNTYHEIAAEMYKKAVKASEFSDEVYILDNSSNTGKALSDVEDLIIFNKILTPEMKKNFHFTQDLIKKLQKVPTEILLKEYSLTMEHLRLRKNDKYATKEDLNAFVKGSFDCVHLGHFLLLTKTKLIASILLNRDLSNTKLTAVLSEQDGGKHKGVEYFQPQEDRRLAIESTGVVDSTDFCNETTDFIKENHNDIDLFIFGADQNNRYFKGVEEICKGLGVKTHRMNDDRIGSNVSSTSIRRKIKNEGKTLDQARFEVENEVSIPQEEKMTLSILQRRGVISEQNLRNFNLSLEKIKENQL